MKNATKPSSVVNPYMDFIALEIEGDEDTIIADLPAPRAARKTQAFGTRIASQRIEIRVGG